MKTSKAQTHTEGSKVYSYGTHVATIDHDGQKVIAHGKWSSTTTRHIATAARELGYKVEQDPKGQAASEKVSRDTFAAQRCGIVKEDRGTPAPDGILGVLGMFAALVDITSRSTEEATRAKADLLSRTPGITLPDNWDSLSPEEQQRRVDAAMEAARA